ncbi:MAG: glycosyltransferase family 4 protein [Lentisphaeria bacterium]|nr:glycosyltransferase family 4 protein [Lentisphaeria bacterium]
MNIAFLAFGIGSSYSGKLLRDHNICTALNRIGHRVAFIPLMQHTVLEREDSTQSSCYYPINKLMTARNYPLLTRSHWLFNKMIKNQSWQNSCMEKYANMTPEEAFQFHHEVLFPNQTMYEDEYRDLSSFIAREKPKYICCSEWIILPIAIQLAKDFSCKCIFFNKGNTTLIHKQAEFSDYLSYYKEVDHIIFPSDAACEADYAITQIKPKKASIIQDGLALNNYMLRDDSPPAKTLGYLDQLSPSSGLEFILEITKRLIPDKTDIELKLGGALFERNKPFMSELETSISASALRLRVSITPNISLEDKVNFLRELDIMLIPPNKHDASLTCLEAMACGILWVAPKLPIYKELHEKTGCGVLYEPSEKRETAKMINSLLSNPAKLKAMGLIGRRYALEEASIEKMIGRLIHDVFQ